MSNVKRVQIEARFDRNMYQEYLFKFTKNDNFDQFTTELGRVASNPFLGIRYEINDLSTEIEVRLMGEEAVSIAYLERVVGLLKNGLGAVIREARYWDIEEETGPFAIKP